MPIRKRKGITHEESGEYYYDENLKRLMDKISERHMSPVPPDPVLSRLDKIIKLLKTLTKEKESSQMEQIKKPLKKLG